MIKRLFLPLSLLIILMSIASVASQRLEIGNFSDFRYKAQLISAFICALLIFLVRNRDLRKIFRLTLAIISILLILSVFVFDRSKISYFITVIFCPTIFLFIGWAYINQMATMVEGIKYYFAFNFITNFVSPQFSLIPWVLFNKYIMLFIALSCLGFAFALDKFIFSKFYKTENKQLTAFLTLKTVFALSIILSGIRLFSIITSHAFQERIVKAATSAVAYGNMIGDYMLALKITILLLTALSIFVGQRIILAKGWRFGVMIAPILAILLTIITLAIEKPIVLIISETILKSLRIAWLIPMVQIALLSYDKNKRFALQACIFLVISPLLELGAEKIIVGKELSLLISLIIFALMIASTSIVNKTVR